MFGMYFVFAIKYTTKLISVDSWILLRLVALEGGLLALNWCLVALEGGLLALKNGLVALNRSLLANQGFPPTKNRHTSATTTEIGVALD